MEGRMDGWMDGWLVDLKNGPNTRHSASEKNKKLVP